MKYIDTANIDKWEELTPEQKVEALLNYEPSKDEVQKTEYYQQAKKSFDKTASELAELKRTQKATQSDSEKALGEMQEAIKVLQEKNLQLEQEKKQADAEARYIGLGYEVDLAKKAAGALISNDVAKIIEYQEEHIKAVAEKEKQKKLAGTPEPNDAGGGTKITVSSVQDFAKLDYVEVLKLKIENPELYNKYLGELRKIN